MYVKFHTTFWTNSMKQKSDSAKLLFIYLFTSQHHNALGLYFLPVAYMEADLGWGEAKTAGALAELESVGKVIYDRDTNLVFIPGFLEHNPVQNPSQEKHCIDRLDELPDTPLLRNLQECIEKQTGRTRLIKAVADRVSRLSPTPCGDSAETIEVEVKEKVDVDVEEKESKPSTHSKSEHRKQVETIFEEWWDSTPAAVRARRTEKNKCREIFHSRIYPFGLSVSELNNRAENMELHTNCWWGRGYALLAEHRSVNMMPLAKTFLNQTDFNEPPSDEEIATAREAMA